MCGTPSQFRQFGGAKWDTLYGLAVDGNGNVIVAGTTQNALDGTNAGLYDAYVRKYDANGTVLWTRQFGTALVERTYGAATDSDGNVYVVGSTEGDLSGTSAGEADAYVRKYDASGTVQWTQQFGTAAGDGATAVAVDASGNVYVAGNTLGSLGGANVGAAVDAFLRKYDSAGAVQWTRQLGTSVADYAWGVAVDGSGNVVIVGDTAGALGGTNAGGLYDAYARKFAPNGSVLWTKQFGTAGTDTARGVVAGGGDSVTLTGTTEGALVGTNQGAGDAYVRRLDSAGTAVWTSQFGTPNTDAGTALVVVSDGSTIVTGHTHGALFGTNAGDADVFVRKYSSSGNVQSFEQFGTIGADYARTIAVDGNGNVYLGGDTPGTLGSANAGSGDAFVYKLP